MEYICEVCGISFFNIKFAKRCKEHRLPPKEYQKEYRIKHRNSLLEYHKKYHEDHRIKDLETKNKKGRLFYEKWFKDKECANCHKKWNEVNLVYHHIIPNQKIDGIGRLYYKSDEIIINEIKKCIVLCRSCHMILHHKIRPGFWE